MNNDDLEQAAMWIIGWLCLYIGLASQVGYLTGVLKSLELEYKSCGGWIEEHTDWLKQNKIKKNK